MLVQESDDLLRPREVAEIFGVRTATVARWAREGKLTPFRTPGGHRRYSRTAVRELMAADAEPDAELQKIVDDAVRLYDQGWSIRQVASRFECSYGVMRRLLMNEVTLRNRGGAYQTAE
jgi:excisionase family DNA binding protein